MIENLSRRNFLTRGGAAVSAVWLSTHWPAVVAAAEHAHQAAKSSAPPKFQFFTREEAAEIDAITALITFAVDDQKTYREGLPGLQLRVRELFPALEKFSAATSEQQDQILHSLDEQTGPARKHSRSSGASSSFFQAVRVHTIVAFLIDPDSGGNRDGVGWKVIGREPEHVFQPPFGYYDKDYAGWQPTPPDAEKTKA